MSARQKIDADTWAESGGSAGMFGRLWKAGKLEIVPSPEDGSQIIPDLSTLKAKAPARRKTR